jgi:hypothetical protein
MTEPGDLESQLREAGETVEAATKNGQIDKAMDSLESLAKLGKRAQAMRDSIHGAEPAEESWTSDEESNDEDPTETTPSPPETKPSPSETKPSLPETKPSPSESKRSPPKPKTMPPKSAATPAPAAPATAPVGQGFLTVDSDPFATIYVDGVSVGPTAVFKRKLVGGKHVVRAVLADGREKTFDVVIEDGKTVNLGKLRWP